MFLYDDKVFIGQKIKQLRNDADLSQAQLSEKIGMTEKNLSNIERGLQFPALNNFLRLLEVFNVSLSEFGFDFKNVENNERQNLIKQIYLSNDKEISAYLNIINTIKSIK